MKIPLKTQINALDRELSNLRGHLDNIRRLTAQKKYDPTMLKIAEDRIPPLEAAKKSLEFMEKNQDKIRELFLINAK